LLHRFTAILLWALIKSNLARKTWQPLKLLADLDGKPIRMIARLLRTRRMLATSPGSDSLERSLAFCWPADDALRIASLRLLHASGYTPLGKLRCKVKESVVIVSGVVSSYHLKQMAQTIIQRLEGVQSVMNLVDVRETESCPSWDDEDDEVAVTTAGDPYRA
jgi:hypothetical protein